MKLTWFKQNWRQRKAWRNMAGACGPLLALALVLTLTLASPALAAPQMPLQLYGNITVNGATAPAGVTVVASIGGVQYATTTTDTSGKYGYNPAFFRIPADDPDTLAKEGGVNGDTVQLSVGGVAATKAVFSSGGTINLDLSVSRATAPMAPTAAVPAAPADLTARAKTFNQVILNWVDSSNTEDGFRIARSTDGNSFTAIANTVSGATSYIDITVEGNTRYYYLIGAFNGAGDSQLAGPVSAVTPIVPPELEPNPAPFPPPALAPRYAPAPVAGQLSAPAPAAAPAVTPRWYNYPLPGETFGGVTIGSVIAGVIIIGGIILLALLLRPLSRRRGS